MNNVLKKMSSIFVAVLITMSLSQFAASADTSDDDLPPQEPGVTLQVYDMARDLSQLCTLRSGQTPNVDRLAPTIDFSTEDDFGLSDQFIAHALANLTVPEDGNYEFRLTSDDGSRLVIDGSTVIDHDGLHEATSMTETVDLTEGVHDLKVEYFDNTNDNILLLEWRPPGADNFTVVPTEVLSTEADVVRVTAPGTKYCEDQDDEAGDGMRLDSVYPGYTLTDLRPDGFEPAVSAMDWMDDGDLVVVTSGSVSPGGWVDDFEYGEVFVLEGATKATGPDDVTVTRVATDLFNPMGVAVIDDSIFVSERDGLTELTDPDEDGFFDTHEQVATWPFGENFHEFAFGLEYNDDYFYVNLSVAINNGGATTDPQPAENRGTTIKVDRNTGEVSYVAGGLRTPNGITQLPGGEMFAMDNQGDWLPASKLVHVKQDRFFNHFTNPAGPFDDQPVTDPALWIPQNEIGNSPSTPVLLEEGPYAGQLVFGDVTYGGLQRGFLEEVDEEFQGAVFRHSAGLEAGVNHTTVGPDGALYVGGIGEAGNWSEPGKLRYGLQKLTPNGTDVFDMVEMRATEDGFEITYTKPLSEETVNKITEDPNEAFVMDHWKYVPRPTYGGPKVDERTLFVSGAEVSDDATRVTLTVDGLEEGRVVHLRSPRSFTDTEGQELWNTEAWYTLNAIPGYESLADQGFYEAEEATLRGSANVDWEHNGYSGWGFVDSLGSVGASVRFEVHADQAGTHPVHLRYANGPDPFDGTKTVSVLVNGTELEPWALESTGDWQTWATVMREMQLEEGTNTITLRYDEEDDGNINLDALQVGDKPDACDHQEYEEGYTALFDGSLESLSEWRMAGDGSFGRQSDCTLRTTGGMGLLWHSGHELDNYSLKLDWKLIKDDNGGVFVGFPDPGDDPWVAVDQGYEIQIDESDLPDRTTGSIYTFQGADAEAMERALEPLGSWNSYEIRVQGQNIQVYLNDVLVNDFTSTEPDRDLTQGFIGLQNHGDGESVFYRDVRVKELPDSGQEYEDANALNDIVNQYKESGDITNDEVARLLNTHLTSVSQYEETDQADKVVKHLNGFLDLIEYQNQEGTLTDQAYQELVAGTEYLIAKWQ
ncbi:family 16 glycoside hydrolase [Virgibacillus salidurans]|uniref:family 16 glycoside hydrolase n=1 Tax=Virgibacillus salidurans TaxID=2831673 RepID=UPI001F44F666|nr:family 16 glycoside hydrolase [Virgibacillus sp. NKC19-16]